MGDNRRNTSRTFAPPQEMIGSGGGGDDDEIVTTFPKADNPRCLSVQNNILR
jgi:hypothetical protein